MNNNFYKIMAVGAMIVAVISLVVVVWFDVRAQEAVTAAMPTTINYQGYLREPDGSLTTGVYTITAKIYESVTDTVKAPLYATTVQYVTVQDGLFNIVLGENPVFPSGLFAKSPLYLGVSLNRLPEMFPRQRLHAVPWAMQASTLVNNATVYGLTSEGPVSVKGNLTVSGKITTWNGSANSSLGVHFLNSIVTVQTGACGLKDWTTFTVSDKGVPADARAVILEASAAMNAPDGSDTWANAAVIGIRPDASVNYSYKLLQGSAAAGGDAVSWAAQGIFPLNAAGTSFQYSIWNQGFNQGCIILLIGYIR
jgi:hypothetical protein